MTITPDEIEARELDALEMQVLTDLEPEHLFQRRTNANIRLIDEAIGKLQTRASRSVHRPRRTGAPARIAADNYRFFLAILGGVVAFALASFAASFAGQYAMAPNTGLPELLWWLVPVFIDLPIIVLSLATLIFRARGQRVWHTWAIVIALTGLSSAINVAHVFAAVRGSELDTTSVGLALGAVVMGGAPWLVLVSFEELGRLGIKPPEKKRAAPVVRKPVKKASK